MIEKEHLAREEFEETWKKRAVVGVVVTAGAAAVAAIIYFISKG
jgi:hypothetical protein